MSPEDFMQQAIQQAERAALNGEIPIGCVVVKNDIVIAATHNQRELTKNPLHHAEMRALEQAAKITGDWRLNVCDLYVTLEPCPMCLGALFQARIGHLFFGAYDEKRDSAPNQKVIFPNLRGLNELTSNNHTLKITGGVCEEKSSQQLKSFFSARRSGN